MLTLRPIIRHWASRSERNHFSSLASEQTACHADLVRRVLIGGNIPSHDAAA